MDYQGNTDKSKEREPRVEKHVEKVVTGEVIERPKPLGKRFRNIFLGGNLRTAMSYVGADILLPALRNLIVDVVSKGTERVVLGESRYRSRPVTYNTSRTIYNSPINRARDPRDRPYLPDQRRTREPTPRGLNNDVIIASREEANLVAETLLEIVNKYDVASLADFYDLLGLPTRYTDNQWGWTQLNSVEVRQHRDGWVIDLPQLEEI